MYNLFVVYLGAGDNSPNIIPIPNGINGDAITTRYWDCCKPACCWKENVDAAVHVPVKSCQIDGKSRIDIEVPSACTDVGGDAYMCSNQQPWVVNKTLAYGFTSLSLKGGEDTLNKCCICLLLKFKGKLAGKSMLVQNTNTGEDLKAHHFDIAMPGGGAGLYPIGCHRQYNAPVQGWGERYTGVHNESECQILPPELQKGCQFRFQFLEGVDNPNVTFYQVKCPKELIQISECKRSDE